LTCLHIAAKVEEIVYPCLEDYGEVCLNIYSKIDFMEMENTIL